MAQSISSQINDLAASHGLRNTLVFTFVENGGASYVNYEKVTEMGKDRDTNFLYRYDSPIYIEIHNLSRMKQVSTTGRFIAEKVGRSIYGQNHPTVFRMKGLPLIGWLFRVAEEVAAELFADQHAAEYTNLLEKAEPEIW